jgi:LysR family cys regulon transcriptional activator
MTLRQLEYFCEIANNGWNISRAAKSLNTSQPGISRQMQAVEDELGVVLFVREKNRIIGVTEPGQVALTIAQRILRDFSNLKRLRNEFDEADDGVLKIAATHTQARYVIPKVLKTFTQTHPKTELVLRQGTPTDLVRLVAAGVSDFSVSTLPLEVPESVVMLPCFAVDRVAVVPASHPFGGHARAWSRGHRALSAYYLRLFVYRPLQRAECLSK